MTVFEIQTDIEEIEQDSSVYEEESFDKRIEAIDIIDFQIIDQIENLLQKNRQAGDLILLKTRAEKVKSELEEINFNLFQKLRADMRKGIYTGKAFKKLVDKYV